MSFQPRPYGRNPYIPSPRIPGPLGINDAASPNAPDWLVGDTPGPLGINDWADPQSAFFLLMQKVDASLGRRANITTGIDYERENTSALNMGEQGLALLKQVETLRLKPYDDQTSKETKVWTVGATIGYGHLIKKAEWSTYKDGITEPVANTLFQLDISPFITNVRDAITVKLRQNEFDALVILAFNIGPVIKGSSVVKLINNPNAKTSYKNLEAAWKAWNKSQGKVMKGLVNRRQCEWKIYSENIYERW